jgi:hypothetical protein
MSWEDVYFERNLEQKDIIKALAHVFKIKEKDVTLYFGDTSSNLDERTQLVCVFNVIRGDFPIHLKIIPQRKLMPRASKRYDILGRLCDQLRCPALVMTRQSNPYIWVLIQAHKNYQYVHLDCDKRDQDDEIVELEIDDYLYKFDHLISLLEEDLGNLITGKDFSVHGFHARVMWYLYADEKSNVLLTLNSIRPEAKRMYREDLIREAIDLVERS